MKNKYIITLFIIIIANLLYSQNATNKILYEKYRRGESFNDVFIFQSYHFDSILNKFIIIEYIYSDSTFKEESSVDTTILNNNYTLRSQLDSSNSENITSLDLIAKRKYLILNKNIHIYAYNQIYHATDGREIVFFSPELGVLARVYLDWGIILLAGNFEDKNNNKLWKELKPLFVNDTSFYLVPYELQIRNNIFSYYRNQKNYYLSSKNIDYKTYSGFSNTLQFSISDNKAIINNFVYNCLLGLNANDFKIEMIHHNYNNIIIDGFLKNKNDTYYYCCTDIINNKISYSKITYNQEIENKDMFNLLYNQKNTIYTSLEVFEKRSNNNEPITDFIIYTEIVIKNFKIIDITNNYFLK